MSDEARRGPVPTAAAGTSTEPFGATEWGLLAAVAGIWGSSFVLIEAGLTAFSPAVITLARLALGALSLTLVPSARRGRVDPADRGRIATLGVTWVGVPLLLFPVAQQWIDSSLAGMINGAMPLATAAWSIVLLRRLPARPQALGLIIGFAGIVALSAPELGLDGAVDGRVVLGIVLTLTATLLYGFAANLAVPLQQRYGATTVLLRAQAVGLVVVAPFGLAGLRTSTFRWSAALAMVPLGVLGTGLAFVLMATLVGRAGGPRGAVAIYFVPVVAIVLGVALRGERVHPLALAGTGLVLLGAWLTSRREPRRPDAEVAPLA